MRPGLLKKLFNSQQAGLLLVIFALGALMTFKGGSHVVNGQTVSNFLNANTLIQTATDASFFAVMAVGATIVIISAGIDLSVGSIYALCGVGMALILQSMHSQNVLLGLVICLAIGLVCGLLNGVMVAKLGVHPFIITLGTMWIYRGLSFVTSKGNSILVPDPLINAAKANLGASKQLYPVPLLVMLFIAAIGWIFLSKTVAGRNVYAIGGNLQASRYSGVRLSKSLTGVYIISGVTAAVAAFVGTSYYGSASCADADGYELYVIASAVVGGASLMGGKGSAISAMLGAILITMIRQSIITLHMDVNYQNIIIGVAIIIAVLLDRYSAILTANRLAGEATATIPSPVRGRGGRG